MLKDYELTVFFQDTFYFTEDPVALSGTDVVHHAGHEYDVEGVVIKRYLYSVIEVEHGTFKPALFCLFYAVGGDVQSVVFGLGEILLYKDGSKTVAAAKVEPFSGCFRISV